MKPDYSNRKRGLSTMPIMDRIMSKTIINQKTGCWEWTGNKRLGYGRISTGSRIDGTRKKVTVHRLSYMLSVGEIPEGMEVCHKCDNRSCINPEHLFVGTRQDNINDRERKGRNITKIGESNPAAKLTQKIVKECRELVYRNSASVVELAKKHSVCRKTMHNAVNGKTWKCVKYLPAPPEGSE